MGLSRSEALAFHRKTAELERATRGHEPSTDDPQVRADMAHRALQSAILDLLELGPYWIDWQITARASADLQEMSVTAWRNRG